MAESFKHNIENADFKLFLVLWNQLQGQTTPRLHFRMAEWLERSWKSRDTAWLLMAFRSSGKSTMAGLFAAWLLYRHCNLRILVLAADEVLAGKMVRNVKRIIERHPLTKHLKPEKLDQWASDRFTVRRTMEYRDPSMLARGITSNITGSRADIVICDDVEVPNTCDTSEKRELLRERLSELSFVVVPGGVQFYIGTPHHYYSIYAEDSRPETGEDRPFLDGFKRLVLPLLDEAGCSNWPERFTDQAIAKMKRASGPNRFQSQMMLKPSNIAEGRLDPSLLRVYADDLHYIRELGALYIGDTKMIAASAWWDPAFGAARGDHSVLACVFADGEGNLYLHHIEYIKSAASHLHSVEGIESAESAASADDEATAQCRIVARLARRLMLPAITLEINGIGKFLPAILRNVLAQDGLAARVQEFSNHRPKETRILESFDALLAARRLYVHQDVLKTPFLTEMREWRPERGRGRGHDDGLDAVAGALSQHPVRLRKTYASTPPQSWMGGANNGKTHKAKTDFDPRRDY